jgi:hypothetical protein
MCAVNFRYPRRCAPPYGTHACEWVQSTQEQRTWDGDVLSKVCVGYVLSQRVYVWNSHASADTCMHPAHAAMTCRVQLHELKQQIWPASCTGTGAPDNAESRSQHPIHSRTAMQHKLNMHDGASCLWMPPNGMRCALQHTIGVNLLHPMMTANCHSPACPRCL